MSETIDLEDNLNEFFTPHDILQAFYIMKYFIEEGYLEEDDLKELSFDNNHLDFYYGLLELLFSKNGIDAGEMTLKYEQTSLTMWSMNLCWLNLEGVFKLADTVRDGDNDADDNMYYDISDYIHGHNNFYEFECDEKGMRFLLEDFHCNSQVPYLFEFHKSYEFILGLLEMGLFLTEVSKREVESREVTKNDSVDPHIVIQPLRIAS